MQQRKAEGRLIFISQADLEKQAKAKATYFDCSSKISSLPFPSQERKSNGSAEIWDFPVPEAHLCPSLCDSNEMLTPSKERQAGRELVGLLGHPQ